MLEIKKPKWFKEKEKQLIKSGKLDLNGEIIDNLAFIRQRPSLKILDLSYTSITSLEGLPFQPKLEYLILDYSSIINFKNASSISQISKISLKNTPVSKIPHFKLSLLLICGKNLRIIDGKIIPEKLKNKAKQFSPNAAKLVDCGWMIESPFPDEADIKDFCLAYGIEYVEMQRPKPLQKQQQNDNETLDNFIDFYSKNEFNTLSKEFADNNSSDLSTTSTNYQSLNNPNLSDDQNIDPDKLSELVTAIIEKYDFKVEQGDPRITIISSLREIFSIAEDSDYLYANIGDTDVEDAFFIPPNE